MSDFRMKHLIRLASFANSKVDSLWGMYQWLDRAPKGRNEDGDLWWKRRDELSERSSRGVLCLNCKPHWH
jgi:predicted dithiol-disulfide oxidoreductase (DUF899 family)